MRQECVIKTVTLIDIKKSLLKLLGHMEQVENQLLKKNNRKHETGMWNKRLWL